LTGVVDTHCHVDLYDDPVGVIRRARSSNIGIVAVTESPSAYRSLCLKLGKGSPNVEIALGAHPLQIRRLSAFQKALFFRLLSSAIFVGEVGLDFSSEGADSRVAQTEFFEQLLSHPRASDVPMSVHTRGAERVAIGLMETAGVKVILHWYSGPSSLIERALAAGMYFSVNPAMLNSKSGSRLISAAPPERILIETDGPFVSVGSRPSEPTDALLVLRALADSWKLSLESARERIEQNLANLKEGLTPERLF
jgi:TatD DNase family protein